MDFHDGRVVLHIGDCFDVLDTFPENSMDSVATDPPYHLTSIVERFGKQGSAPAQYGTDGAFARASRGFMGKEWDGGDIAFNPELWMKVYRVLKPGGHMVAFGGTRTYHRMAVAIEDAGFEIRDMINWVYGSGFPKSHDISKAIDKMNGMEREIVGSKTITGRRGDSFGYGPGEHQTRFNSGNISITSPASEEAKAWEGWGTALKPAQEPICLARKPLSEPTIAANVLKWGTGAISIDGCRIPIEERDNIFAKNPHTFNKGENWIFGEYQGVLEAYMPKARWPANFCHDGSDEVLALFPDAKSTGLYPSSAKSKGRVFGGCRSQGQIYDDSGSAARFFYTAKAGPLDRTGSKHPTVKPVSLMRWLARLVTPPNGTVLDMFAGTGTTGQAAMLEGFKSVLIEREKEYIEDIERRMKLVFEKTSVKREKISMDSATLF